MGTLYIIGTPIGNLQDISARAVAALKTVALVLAEDTRVAKKLLAHLGVHVPIERCDEHASRSAFGCARSLLAGGRAVALITDAGTPGISDPGARVVRFVRQELPGSSIVPIPGPSALTAALSVSGVNADRFTFLGYPPHRKGRAAFFGKLASVEVKPVVLFESPHRFQKTLASIVDVLGEDAPVVVARELTKMYEEVFSGSLGEAIAHFIRERLRGEFVLIVPGDREPRP